MTLRSLDDRPTRYRVVVPAAALEVEGCPLDHIDNAVPEECRGCSVSADVRFAEVAGELTIWQEDVFPVRIFTGEVSGPFGKRTLSRMVAFAYQHPDPVFLKGWFDGPQ